MWGHTSKWHCTSADWLRARHAYPLWVVHVTEIWRSHGGEFVHCGRLYDYQRFGDDLQLWWWRWRVRPKRQWTPVKAHNGTTQKTATHSKRRPITEIISRTFPSSQTASYPSFSFVHEIFRPYVDWLSALRCSRLLSISLLGLNPYSSLCHN